MRIARWGIVYGMLLMLAGVARAELTPAVSAADLDKAQCRAFAGEHALDGPADGVLEALLGLGTMPEKGEWKTGPQQEKALYFRVAFNKPVALGTLLSDFSDGKTPGVPLHPGRYVSYLKPDAAYPGTVTNDEQWVMLPAGTLRTLAPGVKTRALRFTVIGGEWGYGAGGDHFTGTLAPVQLYTERYYSALNIGHVKLNGKPEQQKTWFGYWTQPQTVVGLITVGTQPTAALKFLKPACTVSPILALPADWGKAKDVAAGNGAAVLRFDAPVTTRALQLFPCAGTVYPLVNLGDTPYPPSAEAPPPPFHVKYTMPMDGFAAVDILDKDGKPVRHLVAEVARGKGAVDEPWDLKDEKGAPVPPGTYTYKAIARPPLKLTYETTVYNAGQPAWWAPTPGKGGGGWMADHTPPNCAVACGDLVFLAAPCNESGAGVIAVDHAGTKVWGEPYVTGFDIARNMAADDRFVYVINSAVVQRIDTKPPQDPKHPAAGPFDYTTTNAITFNYTRTLPMGTWDATHGGLALYKDKLYVAHNAPPVSWLQTCFLPETLDPEHSYPRVWLKRGNGARAGEYQNDKNYSDESYDELMGFYAAFQTGSTPAKTSTWASTGLPSSSQAFFGDAPTTGPLANILVSAFTKPVTISSIVLPNKMPVFALKPGIELPSDEAGGGLDPEGNGDDANSPFKDEDWVPLTVTGKAGQPCIALAPEGGITTRALRFSGTRLDFALPMNRRFANVADKADHFYSEGQETKNGAWALTRPKNQAVNKYNAPMMTLVWPAPVALRGVVIVRPATGIMAVDVYTGPAGGDPHASMADDKMWKEMGRFSPEKFAGWYWQLPTVKAVDFGEVRQVRAVRVRAITPYPAQEAEVGGDWPADSPNVFAGILACAPLGGDPANLETDMSQRLEEYTLPADPAAEPKLTRTLLVHDPGHMVFDKAGILYAVSDGRVVTLPLDGKGAPKVVIDTDQLTTPCDLCFDADGKLYVTDLGPQVVKVFDPATGKLLRTIGKPGGHPLGPWDPNYIDNPTGVAVDSAGKVWVVSNYWAPKRISRWSHDGTFETDFLGPTQYGGGGWMDEGDKSVINYAGMKFVIDWKTFNWKLDSLIFKPGVSVDGSAPDRAMYFHGKRYLLGNAGTNTNALVCEERDHKAVALASIGSLRSWAEVGRHADLLKAFAALDRAKYFYIWTDKNGDGIPQADEVQISDKVNIGGGAFGDDLAYNFTGGRLRPTGFLPSGAPTYDFATVEKLPHMSACGWSTADGRTFTMVDQWDRVLDKDGNRMDWEYFDQYGVFAGFYNSNWGYDRPAGKLNAEQSIFGHLQNVGPNKEEYWITSSDQGDWFCFTGDGMLVGCIFGGPTGYGLRRWTMPEWNADKTDLSDLRLQQECYQGCVVRAEDGKVYAVAGKNHASVVRVDGLEALQRLNGPVTVAPKDLEDTHQWEVAKAAVEQMKEEEKVAKVPYINDPIQVNGALDEWPGDIFFTVHEYDEHGFNLFRHVVHSTAALAYDADNLYIAVRALDDSPMMNSGADPTALFKTGDCVDVQLALDPTADPKRIGPVAGDLRLLISRVKGNPIVMLYKPKDPNAPQDKRVHFTSPVGEVWMDVVKQLDDAEVGIGVEGTGKTQEFVLEAAIPWKDLGATAPKVGTKLRGDVGILQSDQNGVSTVNRLYWSGKSQRVVADLPSEARLSPILWGTFYFTEPAGDAKAGPGDDALAP